MALDNVKFNLKIFQIDKTHHEFKEKSNEEIIEIIRENHKKGFLANEENLQIVRQNLKFHEEGDFKFWTYCYNQPKNQNYWTLFLPDELVKGQNFEIIEFSFVLFILFKSNIYCVIGGSGINVIRKYIDDYFGIDFYQHFAKPTEDVIIGLSTRGIAGNISQQSSTFNFNQTITESIDYSEIPKKIRVVVREELQKGIFKKYDLDKNNPMMEIGAYFSLRKKLDYNQLKELIIDIDNIRKDKSNYNQLTLFKKIIEEDLINSLDEFLKDKICDDVILHNTPDRLVLLNDDIIEVVNPRKLEKFYECESFNIRFKFSRSENNLSVNDRSKIYFESTKFIYETLNDISNRYDIKGKLFKLNVNGVINGVESTFGNFFSHITCEITFQGKKYFRIDEQWYFLEDRFIDQMNKEAISTYNQYRLAENILNPWNNSKDEDTYNLSHKEDGYFVLDKVIKENIEICDVLFYNDDDQIYFVHVKNGFNTQMRNLYVQVILSAKRLWNDIYNNVGTSYLEETLKYYNSRNKKQINYKEISKKIVSNEIKVTFVMAFNNHYYKHLNTIEKIQKSQSNIAKYSLIQTIKEMKNFKTFDIKVIDISEI